jgi:hypothetical protein
MSNDLERRTTINEMAATTATDEAAIRDLYRELMDGWNRGSGDAFAATFTGDGDLIGFDGTHFHGRREIAPLHQELFDKWLKGSRLVGRVESARRRSSPTREGSNLRPGRPMVPGPCDALRTQALRQPRLARLAVPPPHRPGGEGCGVSGSTESSNRTDGANPTRSPSPVQRTKQ